jgi:hypothetical protein
VTDAGAHAGGANGGDVGGARVRGGSVSDWLAFEARVEPMTLGRSTYTIVRLPDWVEMALEAAGARRVEGEIAEHSVNLAISRAPQIDGAFLWTGRSLLTRIGIAPGEPVELRLRPAPEDAVEIPEDLAAALRTTGATPAWAALPPGRRRGLLYWIESARTASTRARRVAELAQSLGEAR